MPVTRLHRLARCTAACAVLGIAAPALAGAPFSFDLADGRLPKNVVPEDYTVAITPDIDTLSLRGTERVRLRVRTATGTLVFNSLHEVLSDVRLDGRPVAKVDSDDTAQLTTVTLATAARPGLHTLTFGYRGRLETQPHGLFVQYYRLASGERGMLLSTKMESTDARRMFPCWDEPAFRSSFTLTMTVPAGWATVSNMPVASRRVEGARATVTFRQSPRMPSYLVEFTGGELGTLGADAGHTQVGIWAVRGREADGQAALGNAREILADYNGYFAFGYPLPKLDLIAVPGGFSGAMENWGAITFNDQLLLVNAQSTMGDRQRAYSVQAHEIAHQWNGDLVTMGWWDDLWLNESFASWLAAKETDARHPDWHWLAQRDVDKEAAMGADARRNSHPIEQHVSNELQAANAFDAITYEKGEAVLRMLESFLGPDVFRDGVRRYIRARAFSNATAQDLWNALARSSGVDIAGIAAGWTEQMGFPLVHVDSHCDDQGRRELTLSQTRLLLRGDDTQGMRWRVPLRVRSGTGDATQPVLLTSDGQKVAAGGCGEALSLNADLRGFYRVAYDSLTLADNVKAFAMLPAADRIALLDDQWALVLAGRAPLASYLDIATALGAVPGIDSRAWQQVLGALAGIEYSERGHPGHEVYTAFARRLVEPLWARLGWAGHGDETPDVQELRRALIASLARWGDREVGAEATRRFQRYIADHAAIPPDDQRMILSIVASQADAATFDRLHALAREESDDGARLRDYLALMDVGDDPLAQVAAEAALSGEIPPQQDNMRLRLLVQLAAGHPTLAWRTISGHIDQLVASNPKYAPLIIAQMPDALWDGAPPAELEGWAHSRLPDGMSAAVARSMESVLARRAQNDELWRAADAYLTTRSP